MTDDERALSKMPNHRITSAIRDLNAPKIVGWVRKEAIIVLDDGRVYLDVNTDIRKAATFTEYPVLVVIDYTTDIFDPAIRIDVNYANGGWLRQHTTKTKDHWRMVGEVHEGTLIARLGSLK